MYNRYSLPFPLWNGRGPSFEEIWSSFNQKLLCVKFGWNLFSGLGGKDINKRLIGHIAHLRKQLKSINTYDYIITLIKRSKKPFFTLWERECTCNGSSFEQTWIPFPQGCFVPNLVEVGPAVLGKKILKILRMYISLFRNYLHLKKSWALHTNKREPRALHFIEEPCLLIITSF